MIPDRPKHSSFWLVYVLTLSAIIIYWRLM